MKTINTQIFNYKLTNGDLSIELLQNGEVHRITSSNIQINQVDGNYIDGSMMNIYLRKDKDYVKLIGSKSNTYFAHGTRTALWEGEIFGLDYQVKLSLSSYEIWFWELELKGHASNVDVIFVQDLGLASRESLKSNEAYISQYIDQNVFEGSTFSIVSRQNQDQNGKNPYLGIGTSEKIIGYATDGYDFFGTNYKTDSIIKGLNEEILASRIYQYEMTLSAIQTHKFDVSEKKKFTFHTVFKKDHPNKIKDLEFMDEVSIAHKEVCQFHEEAEEINLISPRAIESIVGKNFTSEEINEMYKDRKLQEFENGELFSFFNKDNVHVVLNSKEKICKRSHGHILMTNNELSVKNDILTSTNYMNGIFQAHVAIGNTSHNKFLSTIRNSLNVFKKSGQRIYLINSNDEMSILETPSIYEMGFNYSKWIYKLDDDVLEVLVYSHYNNPLITLTLNSVNKKEYTFFVSHDITMNLIENEESFNIKKDDNTYTFTSSEKALNKAKVPELSYTIEVFEDHNVFDESYITNRQSSNNSLVGFEFKQKSHFKINYRGKTGKEVSSKEIYSFEKNKQQFEKHYENLLNDFKIHDGNNQEITKLNTILRWYTHDMLVHFLVPHGLEQYEGAAWGTRDVCQGPVEYFLSNQNYDVVKEIIQIVYSHQFLENGNWPQWFMFDEYSEFTAEESHGDIIIWPLKMLADYLEYTGDLEVLDCEVPYVSKKNMKKTQDTTTIYEHLQKQVQFIKENFIKGTYLSTYADGDWDDTLQPHDSSLRNNMASTWTVALSYQSLTKLWKQLINYDREFSNTIKIMAENIKKDFEKFMINDDVLPGFVLMKENGAVEFIIHPSEVRTDIDYRLLPMIRSIISELFDEDYLRKHVEVINEKLLYPDGARLMNKPANYDGGVSKIFKRAEQAANFGREIGLQYVHAHIRYIESMAKIGDANAVWRGLQTINPILIRDYVENSNTRQANAYFSSSDGDFINRYDAKENYELLKDGKINVNGGWRIYSSGPGIYTKQLISNLIGLRVKKHTVEFDPLIPDDFDFLTVSLKIKNRAVKMTIYKEQSQEYKFVVNGESLLFSKVKNKYRQAGIEVNKELLMEKLNKNKNIIKYYCK